MTNTMTYLLRKIWYVPTDIVYEHIMDRDSHTLIYSNYIQMALQHRFAPAFNEVVHMYILE